MGKQPPFSLTTKILKLSQDIAHELGLLAGAKLSHPPIKLRRENMIKTIQSSLAIEGNTLEIKQITALLEGKRIIAPSDDIQEVQNAIRVYSNLSRWNPLSELSILQAHKLLLKNLIDSNGKWRSGGVSVFKGTQVAHVAPPAKRVSKLMENLFAFIKGNKEIPCLIKACVFHYELEFIHPFSDGNGRMGRLWQQLLLMKEDIVFEFISVEEIIKNHQKKYYNVLRECDLSGDSTLFIEFSLSQILEALVRYTSSAVSDVTDLNSRLMHAKNIFKKDWFARKDYINSLKSISSATASRDLQGGVEANILEKKGERNQAQYRFLDH